MIDSRRLLATGLRMMTMLVIVVVVVVFAGCRERTAWVYDDEVDSGEPIEAGATPDGSLSEDGSTTSDAQPDAVAEGGKGDDGGVLITNFAVGGAVVGLKGAGLILQNNLGDDLPLGADGAFAFKSLLTTGAPYSVTIKTQPTSPSQLCAVTKGSGTIATNQITDVQIVCTTKTYTVGGTVVGLTGTALVLQNNLGSDATVKANGAFTFATPVESGKGYSVTIKTQPSSPSQVCTVSGGAGFVNEANVSSVVVNCGTNFVVGGTITGLDGTVILKNSGGDALTLTANGSFAFPSPIATGTLYAVTVSAQPAYPPRTQVCTVTNGSGTVGAANVTTVSVACATTPFTVGGMVSGLAGTLVLQDNGGDDLSVMANGAFTFATPVASGSTYAVTVKTQPAGLKCAVTGGSGAGSVGAANVTTATVTCYPSTVLLQTFDGAISPALPAGWSSTVVLPSPAGMKDKPWATTNNGLVASAPNAAFVLATAAYVSDIVLDTPVMSIATSTAQLKFNNFYDTEFGGDGGLLEIKIGAGAFVDLVTAGGSIVTGGYPRAINGGFNSAIGNRNAWTGTSNTYIATVVNLPPSCAGQSVVIRWRYGSDNSTGTNGGSWRIDDVVVSN